LSLIASHALLETARDALFLARVPAARLPRDLLPKSRKSTAPARPAMFTRESSTRAANLRAMPPVVVNPKSVRAFSSEAAFEAWLSKNHQSATEVWVKIFKKDSGTPSINASQGIDVALCWGWIDGIRKSFDAAAFLQRYTPRKGKSRWSQINRDRVARLTKAGRMTAHGQVHIEAAKNDGRWDAAYPSPKDMELPPDFVAAVRKSAKARATLDALGRQDTFYMAYRLFHAKGERRAALVARLIADLTQGTAALIAGSPRGKAAAARDARAKTAKTPKTAPRRRA
jgi:uncharacterized protein YdeI (YjbR/CyaY-like superfamily)